MLNLIEFSKGKELFDGHYALIRPLSLDGATADVWLALDTNTVSSEIDLTEIAGLHDDEIEKMGLVVAIKIYRPQNALDIEGEMRFRDEYMIVFNCHHTNLIHPTHFSIFKDTPYLVLPYCKLGSSELLIGNPLDTEGVWKYILDVSSGLAHLHSLTPPIIHQDIKPANILLDDTLHYAITDFGISAQKGGSHAEYHDEENSGTLAYMAPERFQEDVEPMPQSDIWAFGATLFEILTGQVPFGEQGGQYQLESGTPIPPISGYPSDIQRLIHACLEKEPGNRPSAQQLMEAAKARQFPIKTKKPLFVGAGIVSLLIIVGLFYFLAGVNNSEIKEESQITIEEMYDIALKNLDNDTIDVFLSGINQMDSLSNLNYVPAIYQMAFTYGWYSDSLSIKRKQKMQIDFDEKGAPKADKEVNKAIGLFNQILEINDSSYSEINAEANYRLAWYYLTLMKNDMKAKEYLLQSKFWAEKVGNLPLMEKIDKAIASFNVDNTDINK